MSDPLVAVGMLLILLLAIFLGFPVAFTLMALGIAFGYYAYFDADRMWRPYERAVEQGADSWVIAEHWLGGFFNNRIFDLFVNQTYSVMANDVLTAIPLFLFMGYIVERANIVDRLFHTLFIATRRLPGSMAVAALVTCTLFATATGIVGAVVTLMGLLALPAMLKAKYDIRYATGVICAGGTLGILIPPSILLIVYAATSGVSVVRMYAAALLPGLFLAGLYLLYVIGLALLKPGLAPKPTKEDVGEHTFGEVVWMMLTSFVPLAFLILAVLGAILFGFATPTEAAAIGALGGLLLAVAYGALTWQRLKESVYLTARTSAMVCWLFVGSATFASIFAYLGGQQLIADVVTGLDMSPLMFLIVAQLIIFILGWPLEWTEIIVIFIPIFLPLLAHFQIDPLFFGILVAVNLQTAFLSPPMAMSAYYLKGIAPAHVQITDIFRGMMPYMLIVILCMVLIYIFPQIVYWLPDTIYGARPI
ncbi:MAG TPA: TRAP transporter large permease subunit [Rhizobiaceae bacterium]|nr:TRAP transporter large permease subunit [Rhizobiaceae bacterium]